MSTEITIVPTTLDELRTLAKDASSTGFFGSASPAQALMLMMTGKDLGLSYTQSLRAFYIVKGKPCLSADGMVAVCLSHDVCEYFRSVTETPTSVTWETKRKGQEPVRGTFTIQDAQAAGILSDMYKKYPKRMLGARAKSFLARDVYPELLLGIYEPDDMAGVEDKKPRASKLAEKGQEPAYTDMVTEDGEVIEAKFNPPTNAETGPTNAAKAFEVSMAAATTVDGLKQIAGVIAEAGLDDADRFYLTPIFNARLKALKSPGPAKAKP